METIAPSDRNFATLLDLILHVARRLITTIECKTIVLFYKDNRYIIKQELCNTMSRFAFQDSLTLFVLYCFSISLHK